MQDALQEFSHRIKVITSGTSTILMKTLCLKGTVRFLNDVFAPKKAEINKVLYNLSLFRSLNDRNLRTFYPEFVKML
ncbi:MULTISPECIES: hypothetical protein [Nostocales]|uniref:Uncharacterized protein n=3 Tax=Nostocales TaxID=1161 RepID=A0A0C1QZM6_9CYAN|nr:hypothetical protein [Tolypothrix bouteillei]KAF3886944.1 hypothetical protein DA73_0400016715 [Tolypothrix bouteillei VB521301]